MLSAGAPLRLWCFWDYKLRIKHRNKTKSCTHIQFFALNILSKMTRINCLINSLANLAVTRC
ncbi:hypothetical protein HUJ04_001820 [Dendroctonus ponderosae]|nr:hypothetical protein HUJ04_001820 [Dendroctonus ponderosae]KAH1017460.1 hypothetical protein HUJ05_008100 [Dendroctonus ponderosae]